MLKLNKKIPTILWGFFILYLTLRPKSSHGSLFPEWLEKLHPDKIAHFGFWALWYVIFHFTFLVHQKKSTLVYKNQDFSVFHVNRFALELKFMGLAIFIGGIIEVLQYQLNWGRSAEWMDLLCDSLGVIAVFVWFNFKQIIQIRHKKSS